MAHLSEQYVFESMSCCSSLSCFFLGTLSDLRTSHAASLCEHCIMGYLCSLIRHILGIFLTSHAACLGKQCSMSYKGSLSCFTFLGFHW